MLPDHDLHTTPPRQPEEDAGTTTRSALTFAMEDDDGDPTEREFEERAARLLGLPLEEELVL